MKHVECCRIGRAAAVRRKRGRRGTEGHRGQCEWTKCWQRCRRVSCMRPGLVPSALVGTGAVIVPVLMSLQLTGGIHYNFARVTTGFSGILIVIHVLGTWSDGDPEDLDWRGPHYKVPVVIFFAHVGVVSDGNRVALLVRQRGRGIAFQTGCAQVGKCDWDEQ